MRLHWKLAADPLLLFTIALSVGTIWLIGPIAHKTGIAISHTHVHREIGRLPMAAIPKASSVTDSLAKKVPDTAAVRAELNAAEAAVRATLADVEASKADLDAAQRRVDDLRLELAALEAKRAAIRPNRDSAAQTASATDLETINSQRRDELTRLEGDLERVRASIPKDLPHDLPLTRAMEPVGKLPVLVELFENRITPVTKDYFRFPLLALKPLFTIKRVRIGETITEAQKPDSDFADFLSTIHPRQSYVSCLLNADSFEAFYAVRQLTERAGIQIGWEPAQTSSGLITILGVRLATPKDKHRVRVPDVVSKPEGDKGRE